MGKLIAVATALALAAGLASSAAAGPGTTEPAPASAEKKCKVKKKRCKKDFTLRGALKGQPDATVKMRVSGTKKKGSFKPKKVKAVTVRDYQVNCSVGPRVITRTRISGVTRIEQGGNFALNNVGSDIGENFSYRINGVVAANGKSAKGAISMRPPDGSGGTCSMSTTYTARR